MNQNNMPGDSQSSFDSIKENVSALAETATSKLKDAAEPIKEKAMETAAQKKDAGADQIRIVAKAVNGAANELESEMPQIAGYIRDAGQRLERTASQLRDGDLTAIMNNLGDFARNQPAIVFGGAMIAGFALTRFLKSSAQNIQADTQNPNGQSSYGQTSYGQSSYGQSTYGQNSGQSTEQYKGSYDQGSTGYGRGGSA